MGYNSEEHIEELMIEAYKIGKASEVIDRAADLINKGTERLLAFTLAFHEIVTKANEIQRK